MTGDRVEWEELQEGEEDSQEVLMISQMCLGTSLVCDGCGGKMEITWIGP